MSLREDRKKLQRTVLYWTEHCPPDKVLPELLKLKQTVDIQVALLSPRCWCGEPAMENLTTCHDHASQASGEPKDPASLGENVFTQIIDEETA